MDRHERYPAPESNVPERPQGWIEQNEWTSGYRYTKRAPGDWLAGTISGSIPLNEIFPPQASPLDWELDREVEKIEFLDAFYHRYPELRRPKRKR